MIAEINFQLEMQSSAMPRGGGRSAQRADPALPGFVSATTGRVEEAGATG
jgi:hypothetical protein